MSEADTIKEPTQSNTSSTKRERGVEEKVTHQGHPSDGAKGKNDSTSGTVPRALLERKGKTSSDLPISKLPSLNRGSVLACESLAPGHLPPLVNSLGSSGSVGGSTKDVHRRSPTFEESNAVPGVDTQCPSRRERDHYAFSHVEGERGGKNEDDEPRASTFFVSAARVVIAMNKIKKYRRSSAALHTDLLRAFVPDMLIKVSASEPIL